MDIDQQAEESPDWQVPAPSRAALEFIDATARRLRREGRSFEQITANFNSATQATNGRGWERLYDLLCEASVDPDVAASPGASDLVSLLQLLAVESVDCLTAEDSMKLLDRVRAAGRANDRHQAGRRMKAWVRAEWLAHGQAYRSKADFARIYRDKLLKERGFEVTERSLWEDWLRGL